MMLIVTYGIFGSKEVVVSKLEKAMKRSRSFLFLFLLVSIVALVGGCTTLPNVSEIMVEATATRRPTQIDSAKGLLSPQQSKAIMEKLKQSV
jgi:hypothetical protein